MIKNLVYCTHLNNGWYVTIICLELHEDAAKARE